MTEPIRLRFAPSPTGYLHVGGARTALFNWLYARKVGGAFLLRIEDTDKERSTDAHTQVILDGLRWLGLDWDEDLVFQGARVERHREMADKLQETGHAYLEEGALRFRMPIDEIGWTDFVHGPISFQGTDLKDWVILRSDRTPTYNFSVVVDDIDMRISHVMRGDDHISNTPKQIAVYRAFGAALPEFGHVPMIHGMDGKKLSKRHGATAVGDYQQLGILPETMVNFLALLGWSPGGDRELFFDLKELVEAFSLESLQKSSSIFDMKKLEWMNSRHMAQTPPEKVMPLLPPLLEKLGVTGYDASEAANAVKAVLTRCRTTVELAQQVGVRLDDHLVQRDKTGDKLVAKDPDAFRSFIEASHKALEAVPADQWQPATLEAALKSLAESMGVKPGDLFQAIRVALTGGTASEPAHELIWAVGRTRTLHRLTRALT